MEKTRWKIRVDDGFCSYDYEIDGRGDTSIQKIAEHVSDFLEGEIIGEAKFVENTLGGKLFKEAESLLEELKSKTE